MQRGDARIEEGGAVVGTELLAPPEIGTGWRLLGHRRLRRCMSVSAVAPATMVLNMVISHGIFSLPR